MRCQVKCRPAMMLLIAFLGVGFADVSARDGARDTSHPAAPPVTDAEGGGPFPVVRPESVGIATRDLDRIVERVRGWVEEDEIVGAEILILKHGKVVLHKGVGWQDRETGVAMRPNSIFCIRSMTKPLVGTAIQMLVDEGNLTLADPVSKYIPAFDNDKSRTITIEQLLMHTAGLPLTMFNRPLSTYKNQREMVDLAGKAGPQFMPGSDFFYSDCDSETLAELVTIVSGVPVEQFLQKRLFGPLGMIDTWCLIGKETPRARLCASYLGQPGFWQKFWSNQEPPFFPFFLGSQSAYSSTFDYARFLALWLDRGQANGKRLLSQAAVARAVRPIRPMYGLSFDPKIKLQFPSGLPGMKTYYGQHWMVYQGDKPAREGSLPVFGHGGSDGTFAWVFPDQELMAFYFTQSRNGTSYIRFEALLAPLVGLKEPAEENRLPRERLKPYLGCYRDEAKKSYVHIGRHGNRLAVEFPGERVVLLHWPNAAGRWPLSDLEQGPALRFQSGAKGEITGLTMFEDGNEYVLARMLPEKGQPSATELNAECRRKQGGDRLDQLRTLRLKGSAQAGLVKVDLEFFARGTEQLAWRTKRDGLTERIVVDHGRAWRGPEGKDLAELDGMFREQLALSGPFARWVDWQRAHEDVEVLRKGMVGDEEVWVVRMVPRTLPASLRYVSVKTGLVVKEDLWLAIRGAGTFPITIRVEDYRDVNGVLLPFRTISESAVTGRIVTQFKEAEANGEVPPEVFGVKGR